MQLNKLNSCIFLRRVYIQILNTLPPRALPWAVFLLGFQPVFALSINTCTVP